MPVTFARRSAPRFALLLLLVAGGVAAGCDSGSAPAPQTRAERWQADAETLVETLEARHPDPLTVTAKPAFVASLDAVVASVEDRSTLELTFDLMQVVATLGDAHTGVNPWATRRVQRYPVAVRDFPGGLYVTRAAGEHADLLGARLVRIGDTPVAEAYAAVQSTVSHENDMLLRETAARRLTLGGVLHGLGVLPAIQTGAFVFERDGTRIERTLTTNGLGAWQGGTPSRTLVPTDRYYAVDVRADTKTLYLQYNRCAEDPQRPFADVVDQAMQAYETNTLQRVVLDLRHNPGGNSRVIRPLYDAFDARGIGTEHPLAVLIGRRTASSAVLNSVEIADRYPIAIFVGEPTGGSPNSFGEVKTFTLPHSGVEVRHSTKSFDLVPGNAPWLAPDRAVTLTAADYFAGRDRALGVAVE